MRDPRMGSRRLAAAAACAVLLSLAEAVRAEEGDSKFYPGDLGQAIAAILVFVLLLLVLRRWAWGPIITQLRQREERIAHSLQMADEREKEAQDLEAAYSQRMDQARAEAEQVVAEARKQAAETRDQALAKAKEAAGELIRRAEEEIEAARAEVTQELREKTAGLATDLAEKILGRNLTPDDQNRLLAESLEDIRDQPPRES